jgi:predicted CopG family antitoxin
MKTIIMRDDAYDQLCAVLLEALQQKELVIDFMIHRHGIDSAQAKAEMEAFKQLAEVDQDFRQGVSSWRKSRRTE